MHVTIFFLVYLNRVKYTLSGHYVKLMFQHKKIDSLVLTMRKTLVTD